MADPSDDLAMAYFKIGNGIVAFHVLQSIVFFNALLTTPAIAGHIAKDLELSIGATCGIGVIYVLAILGCGSQESGFRSGQPDLVLKYTRRGVTGRVLIVVLLTLASSVFVWIAGTHAARATSARLTPQMVQVEART